MDDELRGLERAASGPAATERDRAAYLAARLRHGRIAAERVDLAARLGDATAALVLGRPADPRSGPWNDVVAPAIVERLLAHEDTPLLQPTHFDCERPRGTNDRGRFRPPIAPLRAVTRGDFWRIRASYGESEVIELVGAKRTVFRDLGGFWFDAVIRGRAWPVEGAPPETTALGLLEAVESHLQSVKHPSRWTTPKVSEPLELGPHVKIDDFWEGGPAVRVFHYSSRWDDQATVIETAEGYLAHAWETWA